MKKLSAYQIYTMNRYARDVAARFTSKPNMMLLWRRLNAMFNNPKVTVFLHENFANLVARFAKRIEREMSLIDPMPDISFADMVNSFNDQFIRDRGDYIMGHVLGDEKSDSYSVSDGLPTSRFGIEHHTKPADDILSTWNMNATRGVQARDDSHESRTYPQNIRGAPAYRAHGVNYNPHHGQGDGHIVSGITFCDQSYLGTQQHMSQLLDNSAVVALNRETGHTNDAFGNATPASDQRLLDRRIFRSNERGEEGGIRVPEARLQRRNLDRDIDETMRGGGERDGLNRGYDMQSLYDRVAHKQSVRAVYQVPCNARFPKEFIYNAHTPVDPTRRC